jgi:heme exporter protein D
MDLGPHAAFVWTASGIVAVVMSALAAWLVLDGKRQQRALDDLESRGVSRRSERSTS